MNDVGNLLQMIYDLLSGWFNSFTSHALAVMEKLNLIETDTASIKNFASDIKSNTDDIKDNTGVIVTPVLSIKTDTTTIKNNVSTMTNQLGTISTNVGTASAFTEDVANNTLDIKDRIVTIGSDTTQLRTNSNTITSDVSDIKTALNYYLANTPVTEDVEGSICNIDTDLADYLQACNVTIPANGSGFSSTVVNKIGKNIIDDTLHYIADSNRIFIGANSSNYVIYLKEGTYTISADFDGFLYGMVYRKSDDGSNRTLWNPGNTNLYNTFTVTEGFYRFWVYNPNGVDNNNIKHIQIEYGNNSTSYEPYKAVTYPVSFGTTITDGAEINLLDGIIKINSTPVSYLSISPIAVRTYKGINNIYSDIGTTALTYRETLKHYLDKQEA